MAERVILLVEDNETDEVLIRRALDRICPLNRLVVARDGVEAFAHLFKAAEDPRREWEPGLVLLDLRLPKIDGVELLVRLRDDARTWNLPVIVLTSSEEEADRMAAAGLGASAFLSKPVERDRFIAAVKGLRVDWLLLDGAPGGA